MKNKAAHTPGPWEVMSEKPWIVKMPEKSEIGPGNKYAAIGGGNNEANARLIAAAPDLLAALESCADLLADPYPTRKRAERLLVSVRAAMAKAKGESC